MNFRKLLFAALPLLLGTEVFSQLNVSYFKDGPYVFYLPDSGKVILKSITDSGLVVQEFDDTKPIVFDVDDPTSDGKFSVTLKKQHNQEPETYTLPDRVFFTSDIEGQFGAFKKMLIDGGVMNNRFEWTYGSGHLYCVGDMLDRGRHVTEVLWLIYRLEQEAAKQGGKVHYLLGNHEIMCMDNDERYVAYKYKMNTTYLGLAGYGDLFAPHTEWGRWYRAKNLIERLGHYTVVHAGVSPEVARLKLSYREMNDYGRNRMNNRGGCADDPNCSTVTGGSALGLYWYRNIAYTESTTAANRAKAITQEALDEILQSIGSQKMIIGHTLTANNTITPLYNNKVINIDVNHAFNISANHVEAMVIEDGVCKKFISNNAGTSYHPLPDAIETATIEKVRHRATVSIAPDAIVVENLSNPIRKVILFDAKGRKVLTNERATAEKIMTIRTVGLPKGTYLLTTYDARHNAQTYKLQK